MNRGVADAAEVVKRRSLGGADDVPVPETIDELLLAFHGTEEQADFGRRALGEDLAELTKLEEGYGGVAGEVLLGLSR